MILEGILTTRNEDGSANISPMGPIVEPTWRTFVLRPFRTSTTYRNLKRTGQGVFHVTDDVELLAQSAIGEPSPPPCFLPGLVGDGLVLADACRWYALRVVSLEDASERTTIEMEVVEQGTLRDFFGLNRAKHAVVEGAILATRLHLLPADEVLAQFAQLRTLVEKTGGAAEQRALALLEQYIRKQP